MDLRHGCMRCSLEMGSPVGPASHPTPGSDRPLPVCWAVSGWILNVPSVRVQVRLLLPRYPIVGCDDSAVRSADRTVTSGSL